MEEESISLVSTQLKRSRRRKVATDEEEEPQKKGRVELDDRLDRMRMDRLQERQRVLSVDIGSESGNQSFERKKSIKDCPLPGDILSNLERRKSRSSFEEVRKGSFSAQRRASTLMTSSFEELSPDITEEKLQEVMELIKKGDIMKMDPEATAKLVHDVPDQLADALSVPSILSPEQRITTIFDHLYDLNKPENQKLLHAFRTELRKVKEEGKHRLVPRPDFHKDCIVYSLYVDLFANDFSGLEQKLSYLQDLGVTLLWLLPILDSPMFDSGFDVRDYFSIRNSLGDLDHFDHFIQEAHKRGIRVLFDIAINHTSCECPWFLEAKKGPLSKYRNYYIWHRSDDLYKEARIIFQGLSKSNWEKLGEDYYFHRFFKEQPDLNYKNPKVLLALSRVLIYWLIRGVDGFRADAVPFLWKEEGTICENLNKTHQVVKFFRAVLDYLSPGTILLAEACQPPLEVVAYFGADGDECQVAYHFPLMPRMFLSMAKEDRRPIIETLQHHVTPAILDTCQWFVFLRVHDELTLEMVSPEERKEIYSYFCKNAKWDFREGQGISARLSDLLDRNPSRISLAYSIMLTLLGTPILFYGDEFGKTNDEEFYEEMLKKSGIPDSRNYVRGRLNWEQIECDLQDPSTFTYQVYHQVRALVLARKRHRAFSRGLLEFVDLADTTGIVTDKVLSYLRSYQSETIFVVNNLTSQEMQVSFPFSSFFGEEKVEVSGNNEEGSNFKHREVRDLRGQSVVILPGTGALHGMQTLRLPPYCNYWLLLHN